MPSIRLGAVDYLNARPLVHGLGAAFSIRFDLPVVCARLLADGEIDLGLVPSIAYPDHDDARVVPGVGIISDGAVASVAIFTRRPIADVRTLALDTSSRTSVALTRILCARVFGIAPSFTPHPPELGAMLARSDAALLIGDPALFADPAAHSAEKIDLGRVWSDWTKRPFVWAFWAGRAGAAGAAEVAGLQAARDAGVASSDDIANRYCEGDPHRQAIARAYLHDNIKYDLSARALEGLEIFYREAAAIGVIPRAERVKFF